ncbi:hypothetical protein XAC3218_240001 [Xanthomonas citri pv. citri]|nr:hypothetical protein XAC3218_240001 [Xanthomonas citri pv. citri]
MAQVGHFYFGAVGQFYIGANTRVTEALEWPDSPAVCRIVRPCRFRASAAPLSLRGRHVGG